VDLLCRSRTLSRATYRFGRQGRFEQRWVIVNALWYPKPK
jgi:hypothetical protein